MSREDRWSRALDTDTRDPPDARESAQKPRRVPTLTILHHPDAGRVGETFTFTGPRAELSRATPEFARPGQKRGFPLADPFVSRKPISLIAHAAGGAKLELSAGASALSVDGVSISGSDAEITDRRLEEGAVLSIGKRVVLLFHLAEQEPRVSETLGLIGESARVHRLRRQILEAAKNDAPLLIAGETGTGKELLVRALHEAGGASRPFVSVNMGAINPALAASELFGHSKGAFTGALEDHDGCFVRADGGVLFLDEIGEASIEVQVMLLRVLETGIVQRVGDQRERRVHVRLVAATDTDLSAAVRDGRMRSALFHRLAGFEIHVPALRERMEDLGRIFFQFLAEELDRSGQRSLLEIQDPSDSPWVPAAVVEKLALYHWPGNIRQLRNIARQLAAAGGEHERVLAHLPPLGVPAPAPAPAPARAAPVPQVAPAPARARKKPREISSAELEEALAAEDWNVGRAAERLGISKGAIYQLIEKSPTIRAAKDIPRAELEAARRAHGGDLDRMARALHVSKSGLRLRLKDLE